MLNIQDDCSFANANIGPWASVALQPIIFALTLAALGIRFFRKPADRTKKQLMRDGVKQIIGAVFLGLMNICVSEKLLSLVAADKAGACAWYFVQIVLDTTVGVFFTWVIFEHFRGMLLRQGKSLLCVELVQSEREAKTDLEQSLVGASEEQKQKLEELSKSPEGKVFLKQVFFWVVVVGIMKLVMVMIIFCFATPLQALTNLVFKMIPNPAWKVIFAKIATPFLMNIFQYWMFDVIFLKEYDLVKESLRGEGASGRLANLAEDYDKLRKKYDELAEEHLVKLELLTKLTEEFKEQTEAIAKQAGLPEELVKKVKDQQITLPEALKNNRVDQDKAKKAFDDLRPQNQTQHSGHQNAAFAAVRSTLGSFFRW